MTEFRLKPWQMDAIRAINEGENRYRQTVLGQGPLPGYPIVLQSEATPKAASHQEAEADGR